MAGRGVLMAATLLLALAIPLLPGGDALTQGVKNSPVCGDRLCDEAGAGAVRAAPAGGACGPGVGQVRTYYVAAEVVEWDYAPSGMNVMTGHAFGPDEDVFVGNSADRIGSTYIKALYREYADETFSEQKERTAEWEHLGTLGPVIRAEVCDTIRVVFKNNADRPYSMHPHGVFYDKGSEGSDYADGSAPSTKGDGAVAPGATRTYLWPVPERAGPGPNDPSSIAWMYHSHADSPADTNAGLVGPLIVAARGMADAAGRPVDVEREMVGLFTVSDENASHYLCENLERFTEETCVNGGLLGDDDFVESNLMHGINGYVYGNLPGQSVREGSDVRWYLIGMGTEVDLHTAHWHGNTVLHNGNRADTVELMPASLKTVDLTADNPGTWMFHCHVNDHISAGMTSLFTIR